MRTGTVLQIEPTDLCNLRCPMCAPQVRDGEVHGRVRSGFMDLALYRRVIADVAAHRLPLDHLILQWLGEPTLHPELEEMVAVGIRELAGLVGYLRFDTNAVALTPSRTDRILEAVSGAEGPPLLVVFSLDADTAETYERVKGRDRFGQAMANIEHFLARRGEIPGDEPRVNTQFQFVLQPENHREVGAFVARWDRLLRRGRNGIGFNEVMIKRLSVGTGGEAQAEADALYDRALRDHRLAPRDEPHLHLRIWEDRTWGDGAEIPGPTAVPAGAAARPPCPAPWKTPVIRWDGELAVCCADTDRAIPVGNVGDDGFVSLWRGEAMTRVRLAHLLGSLDELPFCAACGGFAYYDLGPEEVREYLCDVGRDELWPRVSGRLT
jgi:MoaA/NifB/PqqE/SkfB family radical SAM enzyme